MDKKQIANYIKPSQVLGTGAEEFRVLVEYSSLLRVVYLIRGNTKKLALRELEAHLGCKIKLYGLGGGVWSMTLVGVDCIETYTLIK